MRIRGYDEETEQLSEDLANITGEVIDLTKVASRPEGISLFTDETQTEYKSIYVYLQEISEIYDELGAKEQQELLEKLFGKNRASIGAAIIKNFQAAEKAMNTMADSAGNAEAEMSVIMDSMEYKLNRLKETGTGIAQNLFQRDDMKLVIDVLADLLGIIDKLTESLGLFGTVGAGAAIFGIFKGIHGSNQYFSTMISLLNEAGWSFNSLGDAAKIAGADLKAFAKTPAGVVSTIGLVVAAIEIAVQAYQKHKQAMREDQQALYDAANTALESADAFEESFLTINEFSKKSELTAEEQEKLSSAISTTNGVLGDNAIAFDSASGSAQGYLEKLQEISKEEIKNQRVEATKQRQAAENLLKDTTWDYATGSQIGIEITKNDDGELSEAKAIMRSIMADYIDTSYKSAGKGHSVKIETLEPIDWDTDHENMDAVAEYYYNLIDLTDRLSEEQLTNNDIYSKASTEIANLKTDVEAYTQSKYEELKLMYEEQSGIPTTAGEFIALNDYITEAAGSYGALKEELQTSLYEDFGYYFNEDLINKISDIRDRFTSSSKYQNGSDKYQKEEAEKFNSWIESLSGREIEVLYRLSLDESSADLAYDEWVSTFNDYQIPDEMKLSFSDLIKDEEFRTTVDTYIEQIGVLQEALSKIQSGEWDGASDLTTLLDTFPELRDDTNNLEGAIVDLISSMNDTQIRNFVSQFGYLKTDNDVAALEAFMDSVLKLGQVVGNTSFSINISAETEKMSNLVNAISESVSSTGLSSEAIENVKNMFSGLEGYDPSKLFENTEHGIHLNVQALRGLQAEYEAVTKTDIQEHLQDLKQEYNLTAKELDALEEGTEEWYKKSAEKSSIENQIKETQKLQAQYEGLTSAYNQWLLAQSTENENDAYLKLSNGIEDIKKLYNEGWRGTDEFREAVQLMTDTDLSTASTKEILAVYEKGMPLMERFFTGGTDGLLNFLNTAKEASDKFGKEWVTLSNDGEWTIDFGYGGDAEIAKAISDMTGLSMSTEQVQILLKGLSSAGLEVNLDAAYASLETLQSKVEGTEEYLKSLGEEPIEIDIYCESNVDVIEDEIKNAQAKIDEINNSDVDVAVKTAQLADAEAKLDVLIKRKQELSNPEFMSLKTEDVDASIQSTLILLQNYQTAVNNVEALELKGDDASKIKAATDEVKRLAGEIALLPEDAQTAVGLKVEGDPKNDINTVIESIDSQISNIDATICPNADTTKITDAIGEINNQEITSNVVITGEEALTNLKNILDSIEDKTVTITANTVGKTDIDNLSTSIDEVKDKTVKATVKTVGENLVKNLKSAIDALKNKSATASASVSGKSLVDGLRNSINGLVSKTVYISVVNNNGGSRVDGSAFAQGSAYTKGDWSLKSSGTALGGELGREMIVRDGRYFTIGENSAEFFNYKKGDIIFNHEQTEQLLSSGKITDGLKRGKAYVQGSTSGKAFSSASGSLIVSGSSSSNSNGSSSGNSNDADDFKEKFDWIEIAIDRIERAIDDLDTKVNSTYRTWSSRNKNLKNEISEIREEIDLQSRGYTRYIQEANSVGLDESWAKLVREGKVDITTITDEDLADKISQYQEWYKKALDCKYAVDELTESVSELYEMQFENIATQYDAILTSVEHERKILDEYISQSEEKGLVVSTKYYEAMIKSEQQTVSQLSKERDKLIAAMNESVSSGAIAEGSEAWADMVKEIDDVTLSIEESNTAILEYANSIREIEWETFDLLRDKIDGIITETDFLINLLSNDKLYDDRGQLTNYGTASMGLHGVNYNTYMAEADAVTAEIENINKQLIDSPYDKELIERRQELLNLQQEHILSAEDEKQAIIGLVKDGIELELDALQQLISDYNSALDSAKDLYSYENKIKDQTKTIASLEKQRAAYAGNTSEETKATLQKITTSLEDEKQNLQESEYDRYVTDQKKLLDELFTEYSDILNQRLDDTNALIKDMISEINSNADLISSTISDKADSVGYTLSDFSSSIWNNNGTDVLTTYGENISNGIISATTTVNSSLIAINNNMQAMVKQLNILAGTNISSASISSANSSLKSYGTGKFRLSADEKAWTQDGGQEMIVRPSDGAILTPLAKFDTILNPNATNNIWKAANSPTDFIKDNLSLDNYGTNVCKDINHNYSQIIEQVVFSMPEVKNYDEMLKALSKDNKFEQLINAMTFNKMTGGSQLAKNKSIRK